MGGLGPRAPRPTGVCGLTPPAWARTQQSWGGHTGRLLGAPHPPCKPEWLAELDRQHLGQALGVPPTPAPHSQVRRASCSVAMPRNGAPRPACEHQHTWRVGQHTSSGLFSCCRSGSQAGSRRQAARPQLGTLTVRTGLLPLPSATHGPGPALPLSPEDLGSRCPVSSSLVHELLLKDTGPPWG